MKLIIDIDEGYYKIITNKIKAIRDEISKNGYANNDVVPIGWGSIADGTPLPKGHGDLIDRIEVLKSLFNYHNGEKTIGQCIDDVPTIIKAD